MARRFRRIAPPLVAVAALMLSGAASPAAAQGVRYHVSGSVEVHGFRGALVRMLAFLSGSSLEVDDTVRVQGLRMRTDRGESSTIVDLEAGRLITLDHESRRYEVRPLGEDQGTNGDAPAGAEGPRLLFRSSMDRTGERARVNGQVAERVLLTVEARPDPAAGAEGPSGSMVVFLDMWLSHSVPGADVLGTFREAYEARAEAASSNARLRMLLGRVPQAPAMVEEVREQLRRAGGIPVRAVAYLVKVPEGARFDRAALLGTVDRDSDQERVVTVRVEVSDFGIEAIPTKRFAVPGGYRPEDG